jgi:hypothetical protein
MNAILSDIRAAETKIVPIQPESKKSMPKEDSNDNRFKLTLDTKNKMKQKSSSKEKSDIFKLTIPLAETMEVVGKGNLPLTESLDIIKIIKNNSPIKKEENSNIIIQEEIIINDKDKHIHIPKETKINKNNYRLYLIIILVILCFIFLFY